MIAQGTCLTQPDRLLVERCRRNERAAFDEVVARYKNKVFNYVCRMVGDSEDAEDLTQEVFVRMFVSLDTFRQQASLSTWLFRIASNLCIDHFRRSKKHRAIAYSLDEPIGGDDGEDGGHEVADTTFEPAKLLERGEMAAQTERALAALPEKLRAVVLLHDIEGLPYDEIAQIVGCPLGTVKSRLFNARHSLRLSLSAYLKS